ncbi:MAG: outer membrane lipoprotein-sorting protein [Alphaproteobacteria bacterium]|nr:outer membrane lipoprotein-sorting protein [Alphaproteobacteria bacterium]
MLNSIKILRIILLALIAFTFLPSQISYAATGREVMKMVQDQGRKHKTQQSEVELVILDKSKRERKRYFTTKQLIDKETTTHTLVNFYKPASVKGTGLLTEKEDQATKANQWLYLPAFRSVKQLRSDEQDDSFMGSDFSFSDVAGRTLDQDTHQLIKEDDKYYFISSTPVDKSEAYSRLDLVISKKYLVPLQIVFFNQKGDKFKTLANKGIQEIKGMFLVQNAVMTNHLSGGESHMLRKETKVAIKIHPNDISIKALKKS